MKIPCSIGILTHNSKDELKRTLLSVKDFEEVIVADGGSTDGTRELAEEYGCKIIEQSNSGNPIEDFSLERQRTLDASTCDWFFYIDSDEVMSESLREAIQSITTKPSSGCLVYNVRYELTNPDFSLRYKSFKPNYQTRLFHKKSGARFIKKIHERIAFDQPIKVCTLNESWYVPMYEKDFAFSHYKKKVDYRLRVMAEDSKNLNIFSLVRKIFIPSTGNILKQLFKIVYLRYKYSRHELLPIRYEFFRIYSYLRTIYEYTRVYIQRI